MSRGPKRSASDFAGVFCNSVSKETNSRLFRELIRSVMDRCQTGMIFSWYVALCCIFMSKERGRAATVLKAGPGSPPAVNGCGLPTATGV